MTPSQSDKIKGLFFGQAIGDALGLGTEFLTKEQVKIYYPNGLTDYAQIVRDKHRQRWETGDWTDDTDQFLCICDAILKTKKVSEIAFAEELISWFNGSPMGIGMTVYKTLTMPQFTKYPHRAAELVWKMSGQRLASNGAIMRTAILGAFDFWNHEKVIRNTENIAKVTHGDARCIGSCVIITSIISQILHVNTLLTPTQIADIGEKYDSRIQTFVVKATSANIAELALDEQSSMGYTLKALSAGLWAYFNAKSLEDGILQIIHEGGDADTNACIAGSLLGAKYGYKTIPTQYITGLRQQSLLQQKFDAFQVLLTENLTTNPNTKR